MNNIVIKILKIIESTTNSRQGLVTRNYIDLYYKQYGESKKEYIEKVFEHKLRSFYTL